MHVSYLSAFLGSRKYRNIRSLNHNIYRGYADESFFSVFLVSRPCLNILTLYRQISRGYADVYLFFSVK
jgi:hypothetical protein